MENRNFLSFIALLISLLIISSESYSQSSIKNENGIRTIYLIRHGFYNESDSKDEFVGKELTSLGIAQSRLIATRLKGIPVKFTSLTSSTMTRARQTAMVINQEFPELKLKQDELLGECTPPTWRKDIMAGVDTTERVKCVENFEKVFKEYFVSSPDKNDRNDIIVCHGNVIRYLVTKVLNVDTMSWLQMSITNCSLTIIRVLPDGTMKLDTFGDYGHIPENMRTFTGGENEFKELLVPSSK
jgi:serine/threonine-protein phosphatase PGAM5